MNPDQNNLFQYYLAETNRRLDRIEDKLEILIEHRAITLAQTRTISAIVAGTTSIIVVGLQWIYKLF